MTSLIQNADEQHVLVAALYAGALERIAAFVQSDAADHGAALAFGSDVSGQALAAASAEIAAAPPALVVVEGSVLHGAKAAYASTTNTVFVSADFLEANRDNANAILAVLIEELGHAIDARVHTTDAAGDEGQLFAALVLGASVSEAELAAMKAENDQGAIQVDGAQVAVEFAQYGAINVNGDVSDWTAADRLDIGGSAVAGYQVYGKVVGGALVVALVAPSAINANTTFWLNTDLNTATGYRIWGFAGGAEYNVNLNAQGVPVLYTGADGQTAVPGAVIDYVFNATRTVLEFAIPLTTLGNAASADMLIDHNNTAFLPGDYSLYAYRVDADPPPPTGNTYGNITINGVASDWTAADRLDAAGGAAANFQLYGKVVGGNFVLAVQSLGATQIGANTTIWFNTDQNTATGYQVFGNTVGAEFNLNFISATSAGLYTGNAGQTQINGVTVDLAVSADRKFFEVAIPLSQLSTALGTVIDKANVYVDINNSVYIPTAYSNFVYTIASTVPTVGTMTLDGNLADWAGAGRIDTYGGAAGYEVYGKSEGDFFVFALKGPGAIGAGTTVWLNTDFNALTGTQIFPLAGPGSGGAEFNINFNALGLPALYTGTAGQNLVANTQVLKGSSADGTVVEFAVAKSALGGVLGSHVVLDVNDNVFLPLSFSGPQYLVGQGPANQVIGAYTLDGALTDWASTTPLVTGPGGHQAYGQVSGDYFVFALKAPAGTVIGNGTSIWLNTDFDPVTGKQIFGGGGAEFTVDWDATGTPILRNAAGEAVPGAQVLFKASADGSVVELAFLRSAAGVPLGGTQGANVAVDFNDIEFLPNPFTGAQYLVGSLPNAPVVGTMTIDGSLGDWAGAGRIDTFAAVAGYETYGKVEGDFFVLALKGPDAIGPNTTIWFNTDLNAGTGFQIFGAVGGAEFNINWDANGIPRLYTGDAGATPVAGNVLYRASADGKTIEIAIARASLATNGETPTAAGVLIDVNNNGAAFLPGDYASSQYLVQAPLPAVTLGATTLDGALGDWLPTQRIDTFGGTAGYEVYGKVDGDAYIFALRGPVPVGPNTTVWLNTDLNPTTGTQVFGAVGAEFKIDFDAYGIAHLYDQTGALIPTATVQYNRSADGKTVELAISKAAIGNPAAIDVAVDINNVTNLPDPYATLYRVAAPPPPQGNITLDGALGDWLPAQNIVKPGTGTAGYDMFGTAATDTYVIALKAPAAINNNTTIFLNADQNETTGYQVFGNAGGVEFAVKFDVAGRPALYSVNPAEGVMTLVEANVAYGRSADGTTIELAINKSQIAVGGVVPKELNLLTQVNGGSTNGGADLPQIFSVQPSYEIVDTAALNLTPRVDLNKKVAIVYSESTAKYFFGSHLDENTNKTGYGQLFMTAQSQAAAAGVPFDIITEDDLTNINLLKEYDAIVFPSMRNVAADKFVQITNTLELAVEQYKIGLITSGDFMTHDQNNALLPGGDPYARMKEFFDLAPQQFGLEAIVDLHAAGAGHPIMDGYASNELIRTYEGFHLPGAPPPGVGWAAYGDATPGAGAAQTILAMQTATPVAGGAAVTTGAIIATETGGRNVHFATAGFLGDNNQLQHAIEWSVNGGGVTVGLQLGRQSSILASRNDMDQAQELEDVNPVSGADGIYDKLVPILQEWKNLYNFVGSYYIDIGNNVEEGQGTDWLISKPYFDAMIAMGNEIGSHSYTHPEDTNLLTAEQIQFEFEQSKAIIQQMLGITVTGAAVPGAPEKLAASLLMLQYYNYLSGGASMVGAGYPGAFGYITPGVQDKVYLAPNMSFDFTLVGFQGRTAAEALAIWQQEFAALTAHGDVPIVMWPWHDYGPTQWLLDEGQTTSPYTKEMFTNFIQAAYTSGAEFVTLDDLAKRIASFEKATVNYSVAGNVITATVSSSLAVADTGKFALDLDGLGAQKIVSVAGWYAYDEDSVFLPRVGSTYNITFGAAPADVTHIITLPMRAELLSVTGNGTDISFSLIGEGTMKIDLRGSTGVPTVTGATVVSRDGDILTLNVGAFGQHDVTVTLPLPNTLPVITSNGGGDAAAINLAENQTAVTTVTSTDADAGQTRTYSIAGGADAARFTINAATGALAFLTAPDREAPTDVGGNNVYDVIVAVTDNVGGQDTQAIAVTVTNVVGATQTGTAAANTLNGTAEEESINGAGGNDTINGAGGNDTLNGGAGNDSVNGGDGNDSIIGGDGADTLRGDAGNDTIDGGLLADTIFGGAGNDSLLGGDAADQLNGEADNDTLNGGAGADVLNGGDGNDSLLGAEGADTLRGDAGNDTLTGDAGLDTLDGGLGNDTLNGGAGSDNLQGGDGDDRIIGGAAVDTLAGGAGADTFVFATVAEIGNGTTVTTRDVINDFLHLTDKIDLSAIDANTSILALGDQAFTFLPTAGQAITAVGQLRYSYATIDGIQHTIIEGNVSGTTAPEFRLDLVGQHVLTAADFIL